MTPPPRTQVYLYRNAGMAFSAFSDHSSALLELTDSTVRCTLTSNSGCPRWLAARLHMPDVKQRLSAGEQVTVFEFPRNGYRIKWPTLAMGTVFKISQGDARDWVVKVNTPGYGGADLVPNVDYVSSRKTYKEWRQALDPTRQHVPSSYQRSSATPPGPQQQTPPALPPPGWYPDPAGASGMQRYWDGTRWNPTAKPPGPGHS